MEAAGRRTDRNVELSLFERPQSFDFFQAVRLLLWFSPERQPVGEAASFRNEVVRFRGHISNAFPASAIYDLIKHVTGDLPEMTVSFMGLIGPLGRLPAWYTEHLIDLEREDDHATAEFFDIFHHRLVSLFYRSWERHHFPVLYEREVHHPSSKGSRFTQYLFDLIGLGEPTVRRQLQIPDQALLFYAGLIAQRPHSAIALRGILRDYFGLNVEIEQFRSRWFPLEHDNLSYMLSEGDHNQLSFGAVAGDAVLNPQSEFRVQLGPMSYKRFKAFLPGGKALLELRDLVTFFVGPTLRFDIQLILRGDDVPACRTVDEGDFAPLLGLSSWLNREGWDKDTNDTILEGRLAA
ncbi:MAG: type VI secretion system baseplate subunit TssG [Bryobacteraceae bacterium]